MKNSLLNRLEAAALEAACDIGDWNLSAVARALGTDRRTIYRMGVRNGLVRPARSVSDTGPKRGNISKPAILRAIAAKLLAAAEKLEEPPEFVPGLPPLEEPKLGRLGGRIGRPPKATVPPLEEPQFTPGLPPLD